MATKKITVWISKYALTKGVFPRFVEPCEGYPDMVKDDLGFYHANEWHLTETEALAQAEERRIAKLKSLDRQMKRIAALKFGRGQ